MTRKPKHRRYQKPRSTHKADLGTPELRSKRKQGLTTEPLDTCLEKQLITHTQHECGLHLRWLYTIQFGATSVESHSIYTPKGRNINTSPHNTQWLAKYNTRYKEAICVLKRHNAARLIMGVCVFSERPGFLNYSKHNLSLHHYHQLTRFTDGLNALATLWKRR